ncbi:MAG: hypothetical protein Unbinned97contig1000_23 [Prokaryotic dsDNA virus sp.]|nr:MAG: hypothetical protein Unbinned97contig1000_23 [Prokaryotic dsDNA virus sp.]|tara:strand:+ start:2799 stop:2984 length:186 start_codon:yes stop_codon:yes gene_type:complete
MNNQYITLEEVSKMFAVEKSTVYRWIKNDSLPKPIKLGGIKWNREDFVKWAETNHNGVVVT